MISYIKGKLVDKTPAFILLENGGIGYHINISLYTYSEVEKLSEAKVYVYEKLSIDGMAINRSYFGFYSEFERSIFLHLIAVKGINANTARIILSSMTPEEVQAAILHENESSFHKIKGIGAKTAKQIILDLKDKVGKDLVIPVLKGGMEASASTNTYQEASSALLALGFLKPKINTALDTLKKQDDGTWPVEHIIKAALKMLS